MFKPTRGMVQSQDLVIWLQRSRYLLSTHVVFNQGFAMQIAWISSSSYSLHHRLGRQCQVLSHKNFKQLLIYKDPRCGDVQHQNVVEREREMVCMERLQLSRRWWTEYYCMWVVCVGPTLFPTLRCQAEVCGSSTSRRARFALRSCCAVLHRSCNGGKLKYLPASRPPRGTYTCVVVCCLPLFFFMFSISGCGHVCKFGRRYLLAIWALLDWWWW